MSEGEPSFEDAAQRFKKIKSKTGRPVTQESLTEAPRKRAARILAQMQENKVDSRFRSRLSPVAKEILEKTKERVKPKNG